jgi:hypothetical protein
MWNSGGKDEGSAILSGMTARKGAKKPARKTTEKTAGKAKAPGEPAKAQKAQKSGGEVSSMSVNLGHVFSLRPRVKTAFRQENLRDAKLHLQDEAYASIEDAARAVAARALEIANDDPRKRGAGRGRLPPRR